MSKLLGHQTTCNPKKQIKYGVEEAPELMGKVGIRRT